jgi:hypothetical protein
VGKGSVPTNADAAPSADIFVSAMMIPYKSILLPFSSRIKKPDSINKELMTPPPLPPFC